MPPPAASAGLSDRDVLALTLHHEASGDGLLGMAAVGCVVMNRTAWGEWGPTVRDVCLARKQFSCWRPQGGTTNYMRLVEHADSLRAGARPMVIARAFALAGAFMLGSGVDDITNGADHYYAPSAMMPPGRVPVWAEGRTPSAEIGRHVFFRLRART